MFSFVKNLFGGGEAAEHTVKKAADGIYNGLDKIVYTDEERAEATQKGVDAFLKFAELTRDENSIRSVTRRWLAWFITVNSITMAWVAIIFAINNKDKMVEKIVAIADAFHLGWAFAGVVVFYFGVQFVRNKGK